MPDGLDPEADAHEQSASWITSSFALLGAIGFKRAYTADFLEPRLFHV